MDSLTFKQIRNWKVQYHVQNQYRCGIFFLYISISFVLPFKHSSSSGWNRKLQKRDFSLCPLFSSHSYFVLRIFCTTLEHSNTWISCSEDRTVSWWLTTVVFIYLVFCLFATHIVVRQRSLCWKNSYFLSLALFCFVIFCLYTTCLTFCFSLLSYTLGFFFRNDFVW